MKVDDRVIAFDKIDWICAGRPDDDKQSFWRPATILKITEDHPDIPGIAVITWDHAGPRNTSHGHLIENLVLEVDWESFKNIKWPTRSA